MPKADVAQISGTVELAAWGLSPLEQAAVAIAAGIRGTACMPRYHDPDRTDEEHAEMLRVQAVEVVDFAEAVLTECDRRHSRSVTVEPYPSTPSEKALALLAGAGHKAAKAKQRHDSDPDLDGTWYMLVEAKRELVNAFRDFCKTLED
jgi:hypothetical protein